MNFPIYLSLGSNLGNRKSNLKKALIMLNHHGVEIRKNSHLYETDPVEVTNQPKFLNLASEISSSLEPLALLQICLTVERALGRVRTREKESREIDIDILFYQERLIRTSYLIVPHPALYRRNFVLFPLDEIAPDFTDPLRDQTIRQLRQECQDHSAVLRLAGGGIS